ncbi:MAG: acetyl-CoA carboxylase biotin carboxyl carrier protein [Burkholderiaceae bacterium]|nr:acetyl-CoA carboxylase biotin carboxyl carrier protein [Burkholderiaceae bacterium]
MGLTHKDVETILSLIEGSGYDEIKLEFDDFKIEVRRSVGEDATPRRIAPAEPAASAPAPAQPDARHAPAAPPPGTTVQARPADDRIPDGCVAIRSPILGTFYRAPSPEKAPFVEVGSRVGAEDSVCLVEVMKLFNSVPAGQAGVIEEIRAQNGALVEFGEVLMILRPDAGRTGA